jgi:hypothetical protein
MTKNSFNNKIQFMKMATILVKRIGLMFSDDCEVIPELTHALNVALIILNPFKNRSEHQV